MSGGSEFQVDGPAGEEGNREGEWKGLEREKKTEEEREEGEREGRRKREMEISGGGEFAPFALGGIDASGCIWGATYP